jgi:3-phenylpropionate/trans-cinnamate dioxygenase ferredoxin reductase component
MTASRIAIIGAGQCAAAAAAALRSRGYDGDLTVIGAEAEPPYERPPLSKDYLVGKATADELRIKAPDWYADHAVELHLATSVVRVDPAGRLLHLSDGRTVGYDVLLIASGGRPRTLPDVSDERVVYLRTRADADALREKIRAAGDIAILGGGFIGCEAAAAARTLGAQVTILEMQDTLLQAPLGPEAGAAVTGIHQAAGVTVRTGESVRTVTTGPGGVSVQTDRGELRCGLLLVAIGMVPNTEFLAGSGLRLDRGVVTDEYCRTSIDGIYAAGDVAVTYHRGHGAHLRVEHYDNAIKQGTAAAAALLGDGEPYTDPHWFWSDQYQHNLQSVGLAHRYDQAVLRGSVEDASFSVFYLAAGTVRSVFALNRPKDVSVGRRMVVSQLRPDPHALADPGTDLRELIRPPLRPPLHPPQGQA